MFQGSEIYGGMGNTWDYGPIGVELKNNIKKAWWKRFVQQSENSFGVDAAILMNSSPFCDERFNALVFFFFGEGRVVCFELGP